MSDADSKQRQLKAYDTMIERVRQLLHAAEEKTVTPLEHAIHAAREKAVELGEISREEAEKIGEYLLRDLHELALHMDDTGAELRTWFHMDVELIEAKLVDLMGQVADKTRLELAELATSAQSPILYHTGEVSGPGTLQCSSCAEHIRFTKTGHIPRCPNCHATEFVRVTGANNS